MKKTIVTKMMLGAAGIALLIISADVIAYGKKMNRAEETMYASPEKTEHKKMMRHTHKDYMLRTAMRRLWVDHAVWTHDYLIAATQNIPAEYKKLSAERLLKNQDEIGNAVVPFYGKDAGKKLAALLRDHIMIATEVVDAAKSGDKEALKKADDKWHANAKDIAAFLSGANPKNWSEADMVAMLNEHLKLTTQEAVALIGNKWADLIAVYDKIITQLMHMADGLSEGIIKQFPEKFDYRPIRKTMKKAMHAIREKLHMKKKTERVAE